MNIPKSYTEAVGNENAANWKHAMSKELQTLSEMGTWSLTKLAAGIKLWIIDGFMRLRLMNMKSWSVIKLD